MEDIRERGGVIVNSQTADTYPQKINDLEHLTEQQIKRILSYNHNSDLQLKFACIGAGLVVGRYTSAAREIAKRAGRDPSTVQNWAHAYWLYCELRRNLSDFFWVRALWRSLPVSHWWLAWDIQSAGYDALYYLTNAHANGWSGRDMLKDFANDKEGGYAPLIFSRACHSLRSLAVELLEKRTDELNKKQKSALESVVKEFVEAE